MSIRKKLWLLAIPVTIAVMWTCDFSSLSLLPPKFRLGLSSMPWLNRRTSQVPPITAGQLNGQVAVITGGSSGIGLETAKQLAGRGATVVLTSRSAIRGEEAKQDILKAYSHATVHVLLLDLASLADIEQFPAKLRQQALPQQQVHMLVLNGGMFKQKIESTSDGFEWMFGAHHVGHFHLFQQLQPMLTSKARVVVTSSALMGQVDTINWQSAEDLSVAEKALGSDLLYAQSKLANALFARELQRRYPSLIVSVNHPGLVRTNILGEETICHKIRGFCFEPDQGALANTLGCVGDIPRGSFILPRGVVADWAKDIPDNCQNDSLAAELWTWTEDAIARRAKASSQRK